MMRSTHTQIVEDQKDVYQTSGMMVPVFGEAADKIGNVFIERWITKFFSPGLGRLKALLSLSERAVLSLPKKVKDNMRSE